ncbi:hypothetical protein ABPG77_005071 [Micractinium sp. CCAP 211/92]
MKDQAAAGGLQPFSSSGHAVELKQALLQAVSRSNNPQPGDSPPKLERAVEAAAEALSAANPTAGPAVSKLLNGSWALLYSGRSRRLAAAAAFPSSSAAAPSLREALQAASDAAYSAFYKYVPVLAGSAVGRARGSSATNLQVLKPGRVDNVVTTKGPLPLRLCVSGSVETARPASGAAATCVAVRFDSFTVRLGGLPETALSLGWLRPLGYVDTLYLDEELRVSVGDKGGLFVLRRVAERDAAAAPDVPPAAWR